jgi:hypothetical protein
MSTALLLDTGLLIVAALLIGTFIYVVYCDNHDDFWNR